MSSFDVFVNGIQPNYIAKTQQAIEKFSIKFQISYQEAEQIISTPNKRICQSISKEQAEKIQQTLHNVGVICLYKPSLEVSGLSLEPIESEKEKPEPIVKLTACPNCKSKFLGDSETQPEQCSYCGVYIKKYL